MKHTNHTNAQDKGRISFQAAACWLIAIAVLASFLLAAMLIPRSNASAPVVSEPATFKPAAPEIPAKAAQSAGPEQIIQPAQSTSGVRPVFNSLDAILDENQIWLLQAAEDFYLTTFGGDTSMINSWIAAGEDAPPPEKETIEQNGMIYKAGYGRWTKWEDFDRYVHTLFTDQCWKERNERSGFPIYIGYNGRMYYIDAAMGGGGHNAHIPDLYRLEEKTDDTISYTVIGHYLLRSTFDLQEGETPEERDRRVENSFDYTLEFTIQLVLTADGWRLNQFASTRSLLDAEAAMIAAGMFDLF